MTPATTAPLGEDDTIDEQGATGSTTRVVDRGASTTRGSIRTNNEDAWGAFDDSLFAVADGMGGRPGGELAAKTAVNGLVSTARTVGLDGDWARTIHRLNIQVRTAASARGLPRAGTALVLASVSPNAVTVANVGDARAYLWRGGLLTLLTRDHTVEAELREAGIDPPGGGRSSLPRHALTRHLGGVDEGCVPDVTSFAPEPGDRLLLVTDGVWRPLRPDELSDALLPRTDTTCAGIAVDLTTQADLAGGRDNATAIVVEFGGR